MKNITVCENRHLHSNNDKLGVCGDHNALILKFSFPKAINGIATDKFLKRIIFVNAQGYCKRYILSDNTCPLTIDITQGTWLEMQLELTYKDIVWKSLRKMFRFEPALDLMPGFKVVTDIDFKCTFIPAEVEDLTDVGICIPEWMPKGTEYEPQPVDTERSVNLGMWSAYVLPFSENLTDKGLPAFIHTPIGTEFPAMDIDVTVIHLPVYSKDTPPETEDWRDRDFYFFIDPVPGGTIIVDDEGEIIDG